MIVELQNCLANNFEGYRDAMGRCQSILAEIIRGNLGGKLGKSGGRGLDGDQRIFDGECEGVRFGDDRGRGKGGVGMSKKGKEVLKRVQEAQVENEGVVKEAKKCLRRGVGF